MSRPYQEMKPGRAGSEIVDQVMGGEAQWSALFAKHDFFFRYRFYLQVIASSSDLDVQNKWYVGPVIVSRTLS